METQFTYGDLAALTMGELRRVGKRFGLKLPKFGNMDQMIKKVLFAQKHPGQRSRSKSPGARSASRSPSRRKKSSAKYTMAELEELSAKQLTAVVDSMGLKVKVPLFGSRRPVILTILKRQERCSFEKLEFKGKDGSARRSRPARGPADGKAKTSTQSRSKLEAMSRRDLVAYARQAGVPGVSERSDPNRIVSDILLFERDPKGFRSAQEQNRARAHASLRSRGAGATGGTISRATKRGTSVEVKVDVKEVIACLRKVPLLANLKPEMVNILAISSNGRATSAGDPVFLQGEEGDGFYMIKAGKADVIIGQDTKVAQLGPGDYFGEGALINRAPRGATIRAASDLVCLFWTKEIFMKIFTQIYGNRNLRTVFVKRENVIHATDDEDQKRSVMSVDEKYYAKTKEDEKNIRRWTARTQLLGQINKTSLFDAVLKGFYKKNVQKDAVLVREGEPGLMLYIVQSGTFDMSTNALGKHDTLKRGDLVGELALMHESKTSATVVARTDAVLWCISRFTFRRLLKEVSEGEVQRRVKFLARTELCRALSTSERLTVAEAIEQVEFKKGEVIVKQGDVGDCMYFLRNGDATAFVNGVEIDWKNKELIGERALATGAPRAATVRAVEPTVLYRLSKLAVETLLGPVKDLLRARAQGYNRHAVTFPWGGTFGMRIFGNKVTVVEKGLQAERLGVQVGWRIVEVNGSPVETAQDFNEAVDANKENNIVFAGLSKKRRASHISRRQRFPYKMAELKRSAILGKGSFGCVYLTTAPDGKTYALKCVSKRSVIVTNQTSHIVSEKQVMEKLDHPFINKLFATFKDSRCVYFLLELCLGGELFGLIQNKGGQLSEDATRFYTACVASMFAYMHSFDIIYRDLKPENLLVDKDGYLKLVDFGFAKELKDGSKTYTLCGTPDYLAPEIIRGTGHGKGVDWWCLGVFAYELVASYAPFYADQPKQTYTMICSDQPISYPSRFSPELKGLVDGLLQRKVTERFGVIKGGVDRIKQHPWFAGFDWAGLEARKIRPPYQVNITSRSDSSNFDDYSDDEEAEDCGARPTGAWEQYFG